MFTLFVVLLIIVSLLIALFVLLQDGSGGGLASMGGGQMDMNVIGGRQAATILTKGTWWLGGIFLFLSLVLSVLSANRSQAPSAVQQQLQQAPGIPAPSSTGSLPIPGATGAAPATGTTTPAATGTTGNAPASSLPISSTPAPAAPAPKKN
ncbi:MAG TPA: preprotein translocase subunit SecG [Gemmatimonadales bacterium]|jgi:preprotein translocase subunit SecG|nr:preprotein translocase subunit SecG [Gemmatimonadales bacterium]